MTPLPQTADWHSAAGPAAIALLQVPALHALFDKTLPEIGQSRFCHLVSADGSIADEVVVLRQNESAVEVCTHAGPGIRRLITKALESHGISVESPSRGDALWDRLAYCASPASAAWILANPEISPTFNPVYLQRDAQILIAGPANAGKSTLINAWCGYERSIVHSAPGTTRDLLRVRVVHRGWGLDLIDSAGLRDNAEDLERSGQDLVLSRFQTADLVLWLDPVDAPPLDPPPAKKILRIQTKIDLRPESARALSWSSKHPEGLEKLADAVLACLGLPKDIAL